VQPLEIDYRAPASPHRQIAEWLKAAIAAGELTKDDPLPSEKTIMDLTGVARTTARRAIAALRDEGLVYTVAARGTYVR
jgi:DNA-binding GntR family transcriptional regulator